MSNVAPVENEHSADASQAIIAATSSGFPARPMGMRDSAVSMRCGVMVDMSSVSIIAGVMQLTRMPVPASSLPSDLVNAITAAFDALYADTIALPSLPAVDDMLTMRP